MAMGPARADDDVAFTTIDKGSSSGIGHYDCNYTGENLVIRNHSSFESFWSNHKGNLDPQPPVPTNISWDSQMVLVGILGTYISCCDSYITFVRAQTDGEALYAYIEKYFVPGHIPQNDAMSNPFHIIALDSSPNVVFVEVPPPEESADSQEPILLEILVWVGLPIILIVIAVLAIRRRLRGPASGT